MKLARLLTIAAALAACGAHAEDAKPAALAPAPARTAAPTQTTAPARAAAPKPAAPATTQGAAAPSAAPAMSESKFLGVLYTAIAKRTPTESPAGDGEVTASFHVNAQGKIDKVTIDKTTSPAPRRDGDEDPVERRSAAAAGRIDGCGTNLQVPRNAEMSRSRRSKLSVRG